MIQEAFVEEFKSILRGPVFQPEDEGYDTARQVYNAVIDRRPALIAGCTDVADVIAAVNFGWENDLLVAVRGGGHNGAGLGVCHDDLVIDLSRMRGIHVDPAARTVRVEGGATWGDVDARRCSP
jgi:FAD/FMN-containing dehydrogenase